jgi:hypothetical protein
VPAPGWAWRRRREQATGQGWRRSPGHSHRLDALDLALFAKGEALGLKAPQESLTDPFRTCRVVATGGSLDRSGQTAGHAKP